MMSHPRHWTVESLLSKDDFDMVLWGKFDLGGRCHAENELKTRSVANENTTATIQTLSFEMTVSPSYAAYSFFVNVIPSNTTP
jgi:hypothetical protein